jgi:hypothetical protein
MPAAIARPTRLIPPLDRDHRRRSASNFVILGADRFGLRQDRRPDRTEARQTIGGGEFQRGRRSETPDTPGSPEAIRVHVRPASPLE